MEIFEDKKGIKYWTLSLFGDKAYDPDLCKVGGMITVITGLVLAAFHNEYGVPLALGGLGAIAAKNVRENT